MKTFSNLFRLFVIAGVVASSLTLGEEVQAAPRLRIYYIPSGAMENTLQINDRIMVNENAYVDSDPKNGDIALFKAPQAALLNQSKTPVIFIKRVVGTPGQTVEIINRKLWVNGVLVSEPYTLWEDNYRYDLKIIGHTVYSRDYEVGKLPGYWSTNMIVAPIEEQQAISRAKSGKIPAGQYLVLGDHRSNSNDSHIFGFVPRSSFRGRALNVFWPLSHRKNLVSQSTQKASKPPR